MFDATRMLFIYVETPLHAGTGRGLGAVDLPIQRERTTGYPMVQASSIKGRLRAEARRKVGSGITQDELYALFGPETDNAADFAGAIAAGDARLLLFPVRSLGGVFAWVTSVDMLERFRRDAALAGQTPSWPRLPNPKADEAWVAGDGLKAGDSVVLEEFSFSAKQDHAGDVKAIGEWLAKNALPQGDEYAYWRTALPNKLCVLPEDAYRDFVLYGTEVQTHVRLDPNKKTVQSGALWTAESLPADSLLYAPLMATGARMPGITLDAQGVMQKLDGARPARTNLGGDETTGQGVVALRVMG